MIEMKEEFLEALICAKAGEILPSGLFEVFTKELAPFVLSVRRKIELINGGPIGQSKDLRHQVQVALEIWINEKFICSAYVRYTELMKTQGKHIHTFRHFIDRKVRGDFTRLQFFIEIEKKGISVGSTVRLQDHEGIFRVKAITPDCRVMVESKNKSLRPGVNPFSVIVVND